MDGLELFNAKHNPISGFIRAQVWPKPIRTAHHLPPPPNIDGVVEIGWLKLGAKNIEQYNSYEFWRANLSFFEGAKLRPKRPRPKKNTQLLERLRQFPVKLPPIPGDILLCGDLSKAAVEQIASQPPCREFAGEVRDPQNGVLLILGPTGGFEVISIYFPWLRKPPILKSLKS